MVVDGTNVLSWHLANGEFNLGGETVVIKIK